MAGNYGMICDSCGAAVIDAGDELVCGSCGIVTEKLIVESHTGGKVTASDFTRNALGGYLGPVHPSSGERSTRGIASSESSFGYLKLVSDFAGREEDKVYSCAKLIERVCEKLRLPGSVVANAIAVMKKLTEKSEEGRKATVGALSAYSIGTACKLQGVTSVTFREVVQAHRDLGRRVKASALIRLSIDSPVRGEARKPAEYLGRVLAKLQNADVVIRGPGHPSSEAGMYFLDLRREAEKVLTMVDESSTAGHAPCSIAAAAVYAAEARIAERDFRKRKFTQRLIAACGDTAEYTLREQYTQIFSQIVSANVMAETPLPTPAK